MTSSADWIGAVGDAWAQEWQRTDRSFAALAPHLDAAIDAMAPTRGRALDIGCGAGQTAIALAARHSGLDVVGADVSDGLLSVARARGAARANLRFLAGDAVAVAAELTPIDLFVSRHGVMFFPDPPAAFAALRQAAASDARLVFSCFGPWQENTFATALAAAVGEPPPSDNAPGPFAFADRGRVVRLLTSAGWRVVQVAPIAFDYRAGAGAERIEDALSFLSRIGPAARALRLAPADERDALRDRVRAVIARFQTDDAVDFPAAAWIFSAIAA